jgi:hypothetical protein
VPLRRGPRPRLPTGATTRPLKPKSGRLGGRWHRWSHQRRQPPLQRVASPAAATTSAPTTMATSASVAATTSALVAYRRWRPPQRAQRGPRSHPPTGVRTRPSKNAVATPTAYDALYDPPGGVGAVWTATREKPWMWQTCAWRNHHPCGGRTTTPRPRSRRQRRRRHQSHLGQGARHTAADGAYSRPAPRSRSLPPPQGW